MFFTYNLENKKNINNARFYGSGGAEAPDKEARDERLKDRFNTRKAQEAAACPAVDIAPKAEYVGEGSDWSTDPVSEVN